MPSSRDSLLEQHRPVAVALGFKDSHPPTYPPTTQDTSHGSPPPSSTVTMPVLVKRDNFASREPGVIVVFCVLGAVALFLVGMWISKCMARRKAAAEHKAIRG
ncbi:hypothetical protein BJ508DRAFT_330576 [Ascobolus immersus RN42]|uniref:Uncharacterized protein n=1 Tax=Ascobolus immersus RN42 TaxID=1160509 RepID=A0A3N4HUT6_ASCIM|nr:hypothetical protein BJ508DRAFT_330576 [Ascobolus immersus RN42]